VGENKEPDDMPPLVVTDKNDVEGSCCCCCVTSELLKLFVDKLDEEEPVVRLAENNKGSV
jgi:hypothetical protein